jgi:uncharacterized protein
MPVVQSGSLNTAALVVPDLYVQIVPPPLAINGVPSNVLGIVGTSTWGPVGTPAVIGSVTEYQQTFGAVQNRLHDLGTAVAIASLQGASSFVCVRVTDGTDTKATAEIETTCLDVTALYSGTLGNQITVTIAAAPVSGSFNVTIGNAALGIAQLFPSISGTGNAFWVNLANAINNGIPGTLVGPSTLVTAVAGAGTTAPAAGTTTLAGGTDGVTTITTAVMEGVDVAPRTGMFALRGQHTSLFMLADLSDVTSFTSQEAFALSEGTYCIATMPAATGTPSASITSQQTALLGAGVSNYALKVMFGDWIFWLDTTNQITRLVSPQAFVAGLLSNLTPNQSSLNKRVFGVIGTQQSGLPGSTQSQTYTEADLQAIFGSGSAPSFDVITNPIPAGSNFGVRGGFNTSANPATSDDSYTRMTNFIAETLNAGMGTFVGQVITPSLFLSITAVLTNFLQGLLSQGLLAMTTDANGNSILPYSVVCNASNNPQSRTAIGYVQANVQVQYEGINKFFIVNLQGGSTVVISN